SEWRSQLYSRAAEPRRAPIPHSWFDSTCNGNAPKDQCHFHLRRTFLVQPSKTTGGRPSRGHPMQAAARFAQEIIRPSLRRVKENLLAVKGKIEWISGPAVKASGMSAAEMREVTQVGEEKLIGEVIKLTGDVAFIQVYESTSGLRPGEPVPGTGQPLSATLGPGMIGAIYDGLQRPLDIIAKKAGAFITRGVSANSIPFDKEWAFV